VILGEMMDFDTSVKLNIYETIARSTKMPTSSEVALATDSSVTEVEEAFQRLYEKRLLVLEPGSTSHIRMAPPFSGVETRHRARIQDKVYFSNCAWDAFGIPAALKRDADIESTCPDCDEILTFQIRDGRPLPEECVIHFAVPAAQWWQNIIYT
jgi:transcription initiation factor IIE alpha subunit